MTKNEIKMKKNEKKKEDGGVVVTERTILGVLTLTCSVKESKEINKCIEDRLKLLGIKIVDLDITKGNRKNVFKIIGSAVASIMGDRSGDCHTLKTLLTKHGVKLKENEVLRICGKMSCIYELEYDQKPGKSKGVFVYPPDYARIAIEQLLIARYKKK